MSDTASPRLSIIVPAYNEAHRIAPTLESVKGYCESVAYATEILVIDDGSEDGTADLVKEQFPGVTIHHHQPNRGKGFSVREGIARAAGEYILFMDADNSTPIHEMDKFWPEFEKGADGVIGSRAKKQSVIRVHQSLMRETSGKCFNVLVRLVLGTPFRDTQCGFKAFRASAVKPVLPVLTVERFGFDPEILHVLQKRGRRIVDIPIEWTNEPNSRLHLFRDSLGMFWELLKIRWRDIKGQYRQD